MVGVAEVAVARGLEELCELLHLAVGGWGTGLLTECHAQILAGGCDGAVAGILDGPAPARSLRDRPLVTRRSCRERRRRADRAPEGDHRGTRGPGRRPLPPAPAPRARSGAPAHPRRRPIGTASWRDRG